MDVRYINPFLSAAVEVLGTMAGVQIQPGKPYLKKDSAARGDVSGIIGLSGEASGSLSVSFAFPVLKEIMRNMLGDEIEKVTDDVKDAVGEMTNMISGSARRRLSEEGLNLQAGIPSIVAGANHEIKHIVTGAVLCIPFTCDQGEVMIEVALA